jgi:hypothetical protein
MTGVKPPPAARLDCRHALAKRLHLLAQLSILRNDLLEDLVHATLG